VSAGREGSTVLRSERNDGDVDLLDAIGAGNTKIGSKLGAEDERFENNTKLGVR
jgi:hypothetical protein